MESKEIVFIYNPDCIDCNRMKKVLYDTLEENGLNNTINIVEYNSDDDVAVDMALKYGIYDIPGCHINGQSFYGKSFNIDGIKTAIISMD